MIEKINIGKGHIHIPIYTDKLNEIIDYLNKQENQSGFWKCKHEVVGTEGTSCPKCRENSEYYFIDDKGAIQKDLFDDMGIDHERSTFMGIFSSEEEAIKHRDKIREFIKTLPQ